MIKKYKRKTNEVAVVETITFKDFVKYAEENSEPPHWSFDFKGHNITHEHDRCYLVPSIPDVLSMFTPRDILIIMPDKTLYVCPLVLFNRLYEEVK